MKPLIGLTPTPEIKEMDHGTFRLHTLNENYSRSIIEAGGLPVIVPSNNEEIEALLDRLDGVVITGGGDISPSIYGQDEYEKTHEIDSERDAFELAIVRAAIERDMPMLGICRGLQMMNVALGGTLHQDIEDLLEGSAEHRQHSLKVHHEDVFQTAKLAAGGHPLRDVTDNDQIEINSFHHQSIKDLAHSLQAIAATEDGVIEAVFHPDMAFCLAVQWHPEMLQHHRVEQAAIFDSFIQNAKVFQARTGNREVAGPV